MPRRSAGNRSSLLGGQSENPDLPRGLKNSGILTDGAWKPRARPDLSSQAGQVAQAEVQQPQELLFCLAEGKQMGVVQNNPSFELLLWPTPQGLSLFLSPPCSICFM